MRCVAPREMRRMPLAMSVSLGPFTWSLRPSLSSTAVPANCTPIIRACAGLAIGSKNWTLILSVFEAISWYSSTVSRIIGSWKKVMRTGFSRRSSIFTVESDSE